MGGHDGRWRCLDIDGDGYGAGEAQERGCEQPEGISSVPSDCDDEEPRIHPAAEEKCSGRLDNGCDGQTDEDDAVDATDFYLDADADGYGDAASSVRRCSPPSGYSLSP